MTELERLTAIEEIKQLKARYWRGVDTRDAVLLRAAFTDDAETDFGQSTGGKAQAKPALRDPDAFVRRTLEVFEGVTTAHHGHNPEIEILSDTEATGIWAMEDHLWVATPSPSLPFRFLQGWGHYHDRYRRTAEGWRIAYTTLKRLRVDTRD